VDWLRTQRMAYLEGDYLMVHAGLLPQWAAPDVMRLAGEVEQVLASGAWPDFIAHMYGDKPSTWKESLTGMDRLRVIVNAMTRMRFCTAGGKMELKEKAVPNVRRKASRPGSTRLAG